MKNNCYKRVMFIGFLMLLGTIGGCSRYCDYTCLELVAEADKTSYRIGDSLELFVTIRSPTECYVKILKDDPIAQLGINISPYGGRNSRLQCINRDRAKADTIDVILSPEKSYKCSLKGILIKRDSIPFVVFPQEGGEIGAMFGDNRMFLIFYPILGLKEKILLDSYELLPMDSLHFEITGDIAPQPVK